MVQSTLLCLVLKPGAEKLLLHNKNKGTIKNPKKQKN